MQSPLDAKFQRIQLRNSYFQSRVLAARHGLGLLSFGPAAFSLLPGGAGDAGDALPCLESRLSAQRLWSRLPDSLSRGQVLGWLDKYIQYLQRVQALL